MVNPHTKFEVSMFTHYEDIKTMPNVEIEVVWGLGLPKVTGNYESTLYYFHVIASYLSKVADLPHLHLVPPLGVTPFKFCRDLWPELSCGRACMILCLAIMIQYQHASER